MKLKEIVAEHQQIHFIKRSAYLLKDGIVPEIFFVDKRHEFVLSTSNILSNLAKSIDYAESLVEQIRVAPPIEWCEKIKLTPEKYTQQCINNFTLQVYSIYDQLLNEINFLLLDPVDVKILNYKTLKKKLTPNSELEKILEKYFIFTNNIAKTRHAIVHHGENRNAGRYSMIYRTKIIMKSFNIPIDSVEFADGEAQEEIITMLNAEINTTKEYINAIDDYLINMYESKLKDKGGIDFPNKDEIEKAEEAFDYFNGKRIDAYFTKS